MSTGGLVAIHPDECVVKLEEDSNRNGAITSLARRHLSHAVMPKIALYLRLNSCCTQKMKSALINSGVVKKPNGNFRNLLVIGTMQPQGTRL